ncbi:MAG: cytochrome c3 family protein [Chloroflexi bacterium]|nr:cytochrome c3 family protein [Chloroflexota bacterium]
MATSKNIRRANRRQKTNLFKYKGLWAVALVGIALFSLSGSGLLYAAHLEDNDAFCASCHTQPESTFYQRSQSAAMDLASAHAAKDVTCIQCHSGAGVTGRLNGMMVGAGDLAAFTSGQYHKPAIVTVPISDANCIKCHADVTQTRDFNRHFHAFLPRWQALDPQAATCVSCHQAHTTTGQAQLVFLERVTTTAVCQQCHAFSGEGGG